jgi:hypothetical protein
MVATAIVSAYPWREICCALPFFPVRGKKWEDLFQEPAGLGPTRGKTTMVNFSISHFNSMAYGQPASRALALGILRAYSLIRGCDPEQGSPGEAT